MTVKTADEIFRDYETDGVPSSGAHNPIKSDIREYLTFVAGGLLPAALVVTSAGSQAVADDTVLIVINLAAPGTVTLLLGPVANRASAPLVIIDYAETAAAIIVLTPNGTEKIGGQSSWTLTSSGVGMGVSGKFYPITALGAWAPGI